MIGTAGHGLLSHDCEGQLSPGQASLAQVCPSSQSSLSWGSQANLEPILKAVRCNAGSSWGLTEATNAKACMEPGPDRLKGQCSGSFPPHIYPDAGGGC